MRSTVNTEQLVILGIFKILICTPFWNFMGIPGVQAQSKGVSSKHLSLNADRTKVLNCIFLVPYSKSNSLIVPYCHYRTKVIHTMWRLESHHMICIWKHVVHEGSGDNIKYAPYVTSYNLHT